MSDEYVIWGCGSQARYVIDNLLSRLGAGVTAILVDLEGKDKLNRNINGCPVKWNMDEALTACRFTESYHVVAHGNPEIKRRAVDLLREKHAKFGCAVHFQVSISPSAKVGLGCIVNPGVVILPNASICDHCVIHSGSVIEHDCVIEEGANLAPSVALAGRVQVGAFARVYTGACVAPGVRIGSRATIGAGSVVLEDVPDGTVYVGSPARRIR